MNRFLQGGGSDVTDGSTNILGSTLSATNLSPSQTLRTDGSKRIISSDLAISDTTGLQATLDSKLSIPLAIDLDMGGNDILNTPSITVTDSGATFTAELTYTGTSNVVIDLGDLGQHVATVGTPVPIDDVCLFAATDGFTIKESGVTISGGQISTPASIVIDTADANGITKYGFQAGDTAGAANGLTVFGEDAGTAVTSGIRNSAFGFQALAAETTGTQNTAVGDNTMTAQVGGNGNTCVGYASGESMTSGFNNTGVGATSLANHTSGSNTTAIGYSACNNHSGSSNVGVGSQVLTGLGVGSFNVAVGRQALQILTIGTNNVTVGYQAGNSITTGDDNICVGYRAGSALELDDSDNVCIANVGVAADTGQIRIGTSGTHTDCQIPMPLTVTGLTIGSNPAVACNTAPVVNSTIVMYDGTTGGLVKECPVTIDVTGNIRQINTLTNNLGDPIPYVSGNPTVVPGAIVRFLATNAGTIQSSVVVIDGSGDTTGIRNLQADGAIDFTPCTTFQIETSTNTATALAIHCKGGTTAGMDIVNETGTAASSILIDSLSGGIQIDSAQGTNIASGGFTIAGNPVMHTTSAPVIANSIPKYSGTDGGTLVESGVLIDGSDNIDTTGQLRLTSGSFYSGWRPPASTSSNITLEIPNSLPINPGGIPFWSNTGAFEGYRNQLEIGNPTGYLDGFLVTFSTTNIVNIGTGNCKSSDNTLDISRVNGSCSLTTSGINGLQTGSTQASDTWYSVNVIADSTGVNFIPQFLLIPDGTAFSQSGYNKIRRVGWIRNNSASNIYNFFSGGSSRQRIVYWNELETTLELLTNGAATVWTNIDISEFIPPTSSVAYINTNHTATGPEDFASFRTAGLGGGTSPVSNPRAHRTYAGATGALSGGSNAMFLVTDSGQNIEYGNSSAGEDTDVWILGYSDAL